MVCAVNTPRWAHSRVVAGVRPRSSACAAMPLPSDLGRSITDDDISYIQQAAAVSLECEGLTHPHPNHGAVLVSSAGQVAGTAFHRAQGTPSVEEQVLRDAGAAAQGGTLYLNLETGDCHGDTTGLEWIVRSGVSRVVMGSRHPLQHIRGTALSFLRSANVDVQLLEAHSDAMQQGTPAHEALCSCLDANEALLHRAVLGEPMSTLKYAMTMDGKIATPTGHAAWVSNSQSRQRVFAQRAIADAVIVGGNTVRRDNPRLTTRREGGHRPIRVVMSRTLDLPEDRNLWDVSMAPTIVMTQQGVRSDFQTRLRDRGVEVVEFDFLTPTAVAQYCATRGFLRCFWECGGTLSAPALASGTIHRVMAFVAPKIIGGIQSYTPVGNLGFVEMTQAVQILDPQYEIIDGDILATGFLPSSGGPLELHKRLLERREPAEDLIYLPRLYTPASAAAQNGASNSNGASVGSAGPFGAVGTSKASLNGAAMGDMAVEEGPATESPAAGRQRRGAEGVVEFYKAWDRWGALSNFSPHAIDMPRGQGGLEGGSDSKSTPQALPCRWASVEHYYQAQKFSHAVGGVSEDVAAKAEGIIDDILGAPSPEEAARIGRFNERMHPELVRNDWPQAKVRVMRSALQQKFSQHAGPRTLLLSTVEGASGVEEANGGLQLVENSPHDLFWGCGRDGTGQNMLGQLLQETRSALLEADAGVLGTHDTSVRLKELV